ncbi:hypothetical protein NQD34_002996 [Periophthalmus magnuspinnatus]|uniref:uncharacterized protein LOC117371282 n=1 Tax=Periophthalmus magnuspinnatus TaxID=409849 RepID=UPI00145B7032|nr:uncharacterized protein LOC117371282 [Periophthalmus magnuspinnatus]KAJ0023097.1 hypothetical protein NQD34_002996 [Periophthalmus magnuspinnatus]
MDTQSDKQRLNNNSQLILVPHKDTIRLLEVYVKRSLSLNDGAPQSKRAERKAKWVTMPQKQRRHSSDPSIHLSGGLVDGEIGTFAGVEPQAILSETLPEEKEKSNLNKSKKLKKLSLWKSFLGLFSRKNADEKDDEQENPAQIPQTSTNDETFEAVPTCPPTAVSASVQRKKLTKRKTMKKRLSRRLSLLKSNKFEDVNPADISVEAVMSVQPTYSYYEKVSEELEKIVHEVKVNEEAKLLTDDEVIKRIIALTKEEGDAIDDKIKDNPTLSNFFQKMSYSSFQMLADAYLENKASPVQNPLTVPQTAPELVKLAFTLDFTARIAGLSRQNIGHITGLGNRYLQDRFEYGQACTDHPWSDCDD